MNLALTDMDVQFAWFLLLLLLGVRTEDVDRDFSKSITSWCPLSVESAKLLELVSPLCPTIFELRDDTVCQTDCKDILRRLDRDCHFTRDLIRNVSSSFNIPKSCFQFPTTDSTHQESHIRYESCSDIVGESYDGWILAYTSSSGNEVADVDSCHFRRKVSRIGRSVPSNIRQVSSQTSSDSALQGVNKGIDLMTKLGNVLRNSGVQSWINIGTKIFKYFGPIGLAFQIVFEFLPGKNKQHDELLARFDQLEDRIKEVSDKMDELGRHISKEIFNNDMWQTVKNLKNLESDIRRYVKSPTNITCTFLKQRCNTNIASDVARYFELIAERDSYWTFAERYDWDRELFLKEFGKPAVSYIIRAMVAQAKCLGVLGASQRDVDFYANEFQNNMMIVGEKVKDLYDNYIPDHAISQRLELDVANLLLKYRGNDNENTAKEINQVLKTKYNWHKWAVNVYNDVSGFDKHGMLTSCFRCVGKKFSGSFWAGRKYGKNFNAMYSSKPKPSDIETKKMTAIMECPAEWRWGATGYGFHIRVYKECTAESDTRLRFDAIAKLDPRIRNILVVSKRARLQSQQDPDYFVLDETSSNLYALVASY